MPDLLQLISRGSCPPKYQYIFPEDGHKISGYHYEGWMNDIRAHYGRNGYAMPENWKEIAEDQLCRTLEPGFCRYPNGELPEAFLNLRFTLDDAINGTKALGTWVLSGRPLVDKSVAETRGATCAACWANVSIPGCGSCVNFAGLVGDIVGQTELKSEAQLYGKVCGFCHCSTKAHVWMPDEVLKAGAPKGVMAQAPEWCWKKAITEN
jgi:hypothetical protein